ncbi:uncharacterized protein LOC116541517 isoform X3 [Sapajus apella]|uniref:Uncharacterized protein LOC116541517 isoform X3 n=1 Tax=Sapajus apella TaxID=9515 RepID=A0A6J3GTE8_SAPAP|nr:uncharacterized protein LOC116541517 isoform X3 [Sapajus apella]
MGRSHPLSTTPKGGTCKLTSALAPHPPQAPPPCAATRDFQELPAWSVARATPPSRTRAASPREAGAELAAEREGGGRGSAQGLEASETWGSRGFCTSLGGSAPNLVALSACLLLDLCRRQPQVNQEPLDPGAPDATSSKALDLSSPLQWLPPSACPHLAFRRCLVTSVRE